MGQERVTAVHGLDRIAKDFGGIVVEASIPKPGMAPTGSYEGEGHILVRHPETEVVMEALRRIVSTVRVELG